MTTSYFLSDRIYYKQLKSLKHTPLEKKSPVDFNIDVSQFIQNEPLYVSNTSKLYNIQYMLAYVLNDGIF